MKKIIILYLLLPLINSCGRGVKSEGIVYSPHGYPMPNIKVRMSEFGPLYNSTPYTGYNTTTDNNGHFSFDFATAKNRAFGFDILCDSGYCYKGMSGSRLSREEIKHINLQLYK